MSDAAWQTVERIDQLNREIEREALDLRIELADARECRQVYRERLVDCVELDRFLDCWAHELAGGRVDGSI